MGKNSSRAVDIFTDAGVTVDGLGSWAAVIVRKDGRGGIVEGSGVFRSSKVDSYIGEARAIANALHIAKNEEIIDQGELVVVRCDNLEVVRRFSGKPTKRRVRADLKEARDVARKLAREIGCRLRFCHIKAHRDISEGSLFVLMNARADYLCCRELGTARERQAERGITDKQIASLSRQMVRNHKLSSLSETVARLTGKT